MERRPIGVDRADELEVRLLVSRAQTGDTRAIERLYQLHLARIHAFLTAMLDNPHDAEDLTVQTFVRMIESIDRFRWQHAPFSAWLLRIARNLAIDHIRTRHRWVPEARPQEPRGAEELSAEEAALRALGRRNVLRMLRILPREQQQVVLLKFVGSFGNAEVAFIIGKSESAVKALQHRALTSLQRYAPFAA